MPAHKDKKRGTWYAKFYYTDYHGNIKQKLKRGFVLKREAEAWERDFLKEIAYQPDMSFAAFYKLFQKDTEPRLREHTIQNRYYLYKNRVEPFFADKQLNAITPQDILLWQNQLIDAGFSRTYLSTCHVFLSTIFNHAVKFYRLAENPCQKAGSIGGSRPQKEMQFWTLAEFNSFISSVEDIKARSAITLLYWSGMRKGELLALNWSDIDFGTGQVAITKSMQRIKGRDVITPPKTDKGIRTIGLPDQAIEVLQSYKQCCYDPSPDTPVFQWEKRFIEQGMIDGCTLSGVKRIRIHDLRHSHASLLIELGYSPILIAQRLGHEKVETTLNTYAHLWPNKEAEMIEELNGL